MALDKLVGARHPRELLRRVAADRRLVMSRGIDPEEIIIAVRTRRAPMMFAGAGLKL